MDFSRPGVTESIRNSVTATIGFGHGEPRFTKNEDVMTSTHCLKRNHPTKPQRLILYLAVKLMYIKNG